MSQYNTLKAAIDANIKENGVGDITGEVLNSVLNAMVYSLGAQYQFVGRATPATNPPTAADQNFFYIASQPGTYTNFSNIVVYEGEIAILKNNLNGWVKESINVANRVSFASGYIRTDLPFSPVPTPHTDLNYAVLRVYPGEVYNFTNCYGDSAVVASPYATYNANLQLVRRSSTKDFTGNVIIGESESVLVINTRIFSDTQVLLQSPLSTIKKHCLDDYYRLHLQENELEKLVMDVHKPMAGKTIVCFGDSITEFAYQGKGYPEHLADLSGANVINVGIGGALLRQRTQPALNPIDDNTAYAGLDLVNMVKSVCGVSYDSTHTYADVALNAANYIKDHSTDDNTEIISRLLAIDWSNVDYVTIFAGTNDWRLGNTYGSFGESGTTDVNTTLGAINTIIQLLLTTYPHLHIYWFTPIVRYYGNEIIDSDFSDVKISGGKTLRELSADIYNEVRLNHIKVCDLYNALGWNRYNFRLYFQYDLVHPYGGFRDLAVKIFKFIQSN